MDGLALHVTQLVTQLASLLDLERERAPFVALGVASPVIEKEEVRHEVIGVIVWKRRNALP